MTGDLDPIAFNAALEAYYRKMQDVNSPYPTEDPREGGGPLGYAIMAYLAHIRKTQSVTINVNRRSN